MQAIEARARQLETEAAGLERVALRPSDMSPEDARRLVDDDPRIEAARRRQRDEDYFGNRSQQALTRQLYGDSPQFQEWQRFVQLYYDLNPSLGGRGSMQLEREDLGFSGETLRNRLVRQAELAAEFARARFVAEETGRTRGLSDLPFIEAGPGRSVPFVEPVTGAPVRLDAGDAVHLPDRSVKPPAMRAVTVADAVQERLDVRTQIRALEGASPRDEPAIKRLQQQERDIAEAMGVAAGVRWARSEFGSTGSLAVDHGAGVTDILHIDPATGRVTVIECKGGGSQLGSREAEVGGRAVRAEQTTPEYLRSLANDMIQRGRASEGEAILRALDQTPPNIEAVVIQQPFDDSGQPNPIIVTKYDVTRSGR
jgi:hypothetical protein